jgi:YidC/Oxa1 family membrane protein insertase
MPTPGSPAAKALAERRAAKGLPALPILGGKKTDEEAEAAAAVIEARGQRHQPQRKNRKKK